MAKEAELLPAVQEQTGVVARDTRERSTAAAVAGAAAEMRAAMILAHEFPRNEMACYSKLMGAVGRKQMAEVARYSYPRGDATVSGPSVKLAREAARQWGNIRYGVDILRDDLQTRHIRGWAWDIETNTKVTADDEFRKKVQRKDKKTKKTLWVDADERDLRELTNRRGAICVRNCLLQLLPGDMIDDALEQCRKTLAGDTKDKKTTIHDLTRAFAGIDVTVTMLEGYLEHPLEEANADELADLRGVFASIRDGNSKREEYFTTSKINGAQKSRTQSVRDKLGVAPEATEEELAELEAKKDKAKRDLESGKATEETTEEAGETAEEAAETEEEATRRVVEENFGTREEGDHAKPE